MAPPDDATTAGSDCRLTLAGFQVTCRPLAIVRRRGRVHWWAGGRRQGASRMIDSDRKEVCR